MSEYDWNRTESERISQYRDFYRSFGLSIFESFEEYMEDKEQTDEQNEH